MNGEIAFSEIQAGAALQYAPFPSLPAMIDLQDVLANISVPITARCLEIIALGVKFLVLILGALGYANMWAAVFADVGVSIIAILNAIRAMRVKLPDMPAGSTNQD